MNNVALYAFTILIWGSTWLSIKYQTGIVPPMQSVFYRFLIAAILLHIWLRYRGGLPQFSLSQHLRFLSLGICLFSMNYCLFYFAAAIDFTTGFQAVIFSFMMFFIAFYIWILEGVRPARTIVIGGMIGISGVLMLFGDELTGLEMGGDFMWGAVFSIMATMVAAAGNVISRSLQRQNILVMPANAWGMTYGALLLFILNLGVGSAWQFDPSPVYVINLIYLALFGSVLAFAFYLTLLGRIGAERAAYAFIVIPIVALILSSLFEGYEWSFIRIVGVVVVVLGNLVAIGKIPIKNLRFATNR